MNDVFIVINDMRIEDYCKYNKLPYSIMGGQVIIWCENWGDFERLKNVAFTELKRCSILEIGTDNKVFQISQNKDIRTNEVTETSKMKGILKKTTNQPKTFHLHDEYNKVYYKIVPGCHHKRNYIDLVRKGEK